jgi:hypothetical protein
LIVHQCVPEQSLRQTPAQRVTELRSDRYDWRFREKYHSWTNLRCRLTTGSHGCNWQKYWQIAVRDGKLFTTLDFLSASGKLDASSRTFHAKSYRGTVRHKPNLGAAKVLPDVPK